MGDLARWLSPLLLGAAWGSLSAAVIAGISIKTSANRLPGVLSFTEQAIADSLVPSVAAIVTASSIAATGVGSG